MPPTGSAYNVDWVVNWSSSIHVATHRDGFTTYIPFKTFVTTEWGSATQEALGVGEVTLPTKTSNSRSDKVSQRNLVLRNVLYVPSAICNVLGHPIIEDPNLQIVTQGPWKILNRTTKEVVGLIDMPLLFRLRLRHQCATQTSLDKNKIYTLFTHWTMLNEQHLSTFKKSTHGHLHLFALDS